MCGFVGILGRECVAGRLSLLSNAASLISYRGAIQGGYYDRDFAVQCFRLPRSGSPTSPQPVRCAAGHVLAFNGQIYGALPNGGTCATDSESLAVWLARDEMRLQQLHLLRGEFSFAFAPPYRSVLALGRDRFGSRPLYWGADGNVVAFGSSARAVSVLLRQRQAIDLEGLNDQFWYGLSRKGTVFDGVEAVPPGSVIRVDVRGFIDRYQVDSKPVAGTLDEELDSAVVHRVRATKAFVAYSGGLDSSLVRTYANGIDVPSYRLVGPNERVSSTDNVREVCYSSKSLRKALDRYVQASEKPLMSLSGVGMLILADVAAGDGRESQLSGEGADELFAGYPYYFDQSASGHPYVLTRKKDQDVSRRLFRSTGALLQTDFIASLAALQKPQLWVECDRQYRLPQHLCSANCDIPTLLAGIDSRLPYLDVSQFKTEAVALSAAPKWQLRDLATRLHIPVKPKQGLYIPCSVLKTYLHELLEDIDIYISEAVIGLRPGALAQRVSALMPVFSAVDRSDLIASYLTDLISRVVLGLWSATQAVRISARQQPMCWSHTVLAEPNECGESRTNVLAAPTPCDSA